MLADYLRSYTTALRNTPFRKLGIVAFAGTGYRDSRRNAAVSSQSALLPEMLEPERVLEGRVWGEMPVAVLSDRASPVLLN